MVDVVILLGSNIQPDENIRLGAVLLSHSLNIKKASTVWLTPAIGTTGPDFFNAAVLSETDLDEDTIKHTILHQIEEKMGRIRTSDKYAPRPIDLDIIIYDKKVIENRLWDTAFILLPVADLVPGLRHPHTREPLISLARKIEQGSGAKQLPEFPLFISI